MLGIVETVESEFRRYSIEIVRSVEKEYQKKSFI